MAHWLWSLVFAAALPAGMFSVDAPASSVRYTIVHKLHQVDGTTHQLEAKAVLRDDGTLQCMVRVPMASFRSGDGNRDEHMLEAVEAGKYPFVVFKGLALLPARDAAASPVAMKGEVELHGVTKPVTIPVMLTVQPDGSVRARGRLDVSLDAHHVERPSLLFVKIDDECRVDFDLTMRASP